MKPTEFLQATVDGVTKFLQNYLRFIIGSLRWPFHEAGRQYFRSVMASDKDISALSYLFTSIFAVSLLHIDLLALGEFRIHDALNGIVRNATADALLPTILGALLMTIGFDFTIYLFHRGGMVNVRRARRLYALTILVAAAAVFWSHIAFLLGNVLGWFVLFATPLFSWAVPHVQFANLLLAYFSPSVGSVAAFAVIYAMVFPLSRYRAESLHSRRRRRPRLALYAYPAYIGILLLSFRAVRIFVASELIGHVEVVHIDCGVRYTGKPLSGILVIRNSSSSDQLLYLDNWTLYVETAVFQYFAGIQDQTRPGHSYITIEGKPQQDPIILKEGETRLLHYQTTLPYAQNIERRHMPDDDGLECPVVMGSSHPL